MLQTFTILMMLLAMTAIVKLRLPQMVPILLILTSCVVLGSTLQALRGMWTTQTSDLSINYCWLYDSLCELLILWQISYLVASLMGLVVHPVAYSFLLFELCMVSPTLQSVLKSILLRARQLALTALLVFCIVYVFSFVSVVGFRRRFLNSLSLMEQADEDYNNSCQSLFECFLKQLLYGLIMGTVTSTLMSGAYDYDLQPS